MKRYTDMKQEMYENMHRTETYHWWFRTKRKIVLSLAKEYLSGAGEKTLIDFGCGCGAMLAELSQYGNTTGLDFSQTALDFCREQFDGELRQCDLSLPITPWDQFDFGVALDMLEHVEADDVAAKNIHRFLRPGGVCIITVPAYQWLWSYHDENCMHKRRYNKKSLNRLLDGAGFQVEYLSYYNTILFPPAALVRLLSKLFCQDQKSTVENGFHDSLLNQILYRIFSLEKGWISKRHHFPFGLSLIAYVKKAEEQGKTERRKDEP